MLTRLRVNGFKNLVDVDVRFGPFTCIAGANGVGKSNLFDAIRFLSALSGNSLLEAVRLVRDSPRPQVRSLFLNVGDRCVETMTFEAEMIVPKTGADDFGVAEASMTFLRYSLELGYRAEDDSLELRSERLVHINKGDAPKHLRFPHTNAWRDSVVVGRLTSPLISMDGDRVQLHQNAGGKGGGRPMSAPAQSLKRTLLNQVNSSEHQTAVVARNEMQSWHFLQLEPAALRGVDAINEPGHLAANGAHLPATLYRLAKDQPEVYERVALRLHELVREIREVGVDRDEKRDVLSLWASGADGTRHFARSLSDGTLRFLALAVLEADPQFHGVLCMEEPENGIHPERVKTMVQLLEDIAVDPTRAVDDDNPLRQVILNTHSPTVAAAVPEDSLLVAELEPGLWEGQRFERLALACAPGTWRASELSTVGRGVLKRYLLPEPPQPGTVGQLVLPETGE